MAKRKKDWEDDSSQSNKGYKSSYFNWDSWGSWKSTPIVRKEIVKPYLNWYEGDKVVNGVHGDREYITNLAKTIGGKHNLSVTSDTILELKNNYTKVVPDHLVKDIYSIYYNKSKDLEFTDLKDSNQVKFKILQNINNSLLKVVSNNNSIASFMYTKEISQFLFEEFLNNLTDQEIEDLKKSMKECNEDSEDDKNDKNEKSEKGNSKNKGNKSKDKGDKSKDKSGDSGDGDGEESDEEDETDGKGKSSKDKSKKKDSDNKSGSGGNGEENEGDNSDDSGDNSGESSSQEDNNSQGDDSENEGRRAGKSGHRDNPLTGHNAKENVDSNKNRKQSEQTKQEKLANKIDNIFSSPMMQQKLDDAISKADKLMSDLEKAGIDMSKDSLNQIAAIAGMSQIRSDIAALSMNKRAIIEAIKNVLDNSKNYFSKKCTVREIDFLEADEIEDIFGIEYIHPIFRNTMLDRLTTEERKPIGKIDLFIDISGSMGSNSGIPGVTNMLFAKSIALAMYKMDLLNNLYTFDTSVTKIEVNELNILMIAYGGGTSIERVVKYVQDVSKNNAICLTDGEDHVQSYDSRMFFMGTVGVVFSTFSRSTAGQLYIDSGQCINFDGDKTLKITKKMLESRGGHYFQKW